MKAFEVLVDGNHVRTVGVRGDGIITVVMDCKPTRANQVVQVQVWRSVASMVRSNITSHDREGVVRQVARLDRFLTGAARFSTPSRAGRPGDSVRNQSHDARTPCRSSIEYSRAESTIFSFPPAAH